jgi:HAD superfamily hydrolase (TIGR01509 family)
MTIQAVFFDMGGTIETFRSNRELRLKATPVLNEVLLSKGINLNLETIALFNLVNSGLEKYHKWTIESLVELSPVRVWKEYILVDYPQFFTTIDSDGEELMYWIETNYYERVLRPEVPAVLEKLHKMGLVIGLISNVCSEAQVPENLKKYGIKQYFDTIVTSSDYGRRKPDPSIFHRAAYLAKVPTSRCVYVGDRILRDILGARRAGFRLAIQINHDFEHGEIDDGAQPDAVIDTMDELISIIQEENLKLPSLPSDNKPIKAFLFDAGDILYFRPRRGILFNEFLNKHGVVDTNDNSYKKEIKQLAYKGEISRADYFRELVKSYGINDPITIEEGTHILREADDDITFFDGVYDTLKELKQKGYLLGIITDSAVPVYLKLSWFDKGGFVDVWDSYISSQEIGVQKPDPKIYMASLEQVGLQPYQAVFVGHNQEELSGAKNIGMSTIAFNSDEGAVADHIIERFQDLLSVQFSDVTASGDLS